NKNDRTIQSRTRLILSFPGGRGRNKPISRLWADARSLIFHRRWCPMLKTKPETAVQGEQIQQVPVAELHPFKDHPFKVLDDEAMLKTVESMARFGVLNPLIVRPRAEGG